MQTAPSHIKSREELLQSKKKLSVELNTIWEPIPGSSQELALDTRCSHTLYHGARGPGKTITQLMRFRRNVGIGYGAYWRGIILDKEFKNLGDWVAQSKRFFSKFEVGAKFLSSAS
jgi:diadenosine tetraphosphatase ApaH/serine/threonine PP2A family protein phosphatase